MILPVTPPQVVPVAMLYVLTCLSSPNYQPQSISTFDLANGPVKFETPMKFADLSLENPKLLGSGGGGAAFSVHNNKMKNQNDHAKNDIVVKISWSRSTDSVRNECQILQRLKEYNVGGVEICLGEMEYPYDPSRVMIFMEPVIEDPVSNILDVENVTMQQTCVDRLIRTMVQMLAAKVVTTDVQPLIFRQTGELFLIDMTEAQIIKEPQSFLDLAKISAFCTEVTNYIPESMYGVASKSITSELELLQKRDEKLHIPQEIVEILNGLF